MGRPKSEFLQSNASTQISISRVTASHEDDTDDDIFDTPISPEEEQRALETVRKRDYRLRKRISQPQKNESTLNDSMLAVFQRHAIELANTEVMASKDIRTLNGLYDSISRESRLWEELYQQRTEIKEIVQQLRELEKSVKRI